jgi:hypothetical protein
VTKRIVRTILGILTLGFAIVAGVALYANEGYLRRRAACERPRAQDNVNAALVNGRSRELACFIRPDLWVRGL